MNPHTKPILLIFPFGLLSHYLRCLVLVNYLKEYFDILFAGHSSFSNFVEEEGFSTFKCHSIDAQESISQIKDFDFSWLSEKNIEMAFNAQVSAINNYKPVAVIGDATPGLKMAAEYTNVPFISLLNGYMTKYYAGCRTLPKNHKLAHFIELLPENVKQYFTHKGENIAFNRIHKPFKFLRSQYSLKQVPQYLDEIEGDYNIICDLPQLFPQKKLPVNYIFTGPLIHTSPNYYKHIKLHLDNNKKTIYVSMGSSGNWKDVHFLNDDYYSRYNIICAGDKIRVLNAQHIQHIDFISAEDILPVTDIAICHGGNGTIYQALLYKVPLLCFPFHFEQEWNADVLTVRGLAKTIDSSIKHSELMNIIEECILTRQYTNRHETADSITQTIENQSQVIKSLAMKLYGEISSQKLQFYK